MLKKSYRKTPEIRVHFHRTSVKFVANKKLCDPRVFLVFFVVILT